MTFITLTTAEFVATIQAKLQSLPYESTYCHTMAVPDLPPPAVYTLIVGAGFSYGVVPLVNELMNQSIGDYYYYDQDQSSMTRPEKVLKKLSAGFWKEYNEAADGANQVTLDGQGLPYDAGEAYMNLFTYQVLNKLFAETDLLLVERSKPKQKNLGELFVQGFLRYILDPGSEHGYGSTGRNELNSAHFYLAKILEAQQSGRDWDTYPFCRTVLTTNFDTLLQNALQTVKLLYQITDRPEKGLHFSDFNERNGAVHLVYTHGSILRHNPASAKHELDALAKANFAALLQHLQSHDIITMGYSGWEDGLMKALRACNSQKHNLYWCGYSPEPTDHIAELLNERAGNSFYIHLEEGADGAMELLYKTLVP